ncbi:M20 family metallopeptidase [Thioclava pacifica]|uniref:Probable succinyl-diaminopimelate desuccinylase n=1 Tax=Thioclava pacifica DSM 10166 TaxID=1353537 RepID=A0A074JE17_9RHOB|nr:M20 family metallopeptidase [Thioclava pacifica]KEO54090.1 hypothetical protein TP2_04010 [Thioclava pacifica DSM 10166]
MDVVDLTRHLIGFDTINPPGQEAEAMAFCADLLRGGGFDVEVIAQGSDRCNLIATKGIGAGRALGFTGHLDTVPLGGAAWRYPPHDGLIEGGKLYGRGSTDMKGGVAAFICAALDAPVPPGGIAILLTAGEETGSDGARVMIEAGPLPPIGALIVAEPTANRAVPGHKGALWLRLVFHGVTAHGSAPEAGVNAIELAMAALTQIKALDLGPAHPVMGAPSRNIGTISGGLNTNSVPDRCEVTLDLRSVPGIVHDDLVAKIETCLPAGTELARIIDLPAVWTDPDDPWIEGITELSARVANQPSNPMAMSYFTDASIFTPALDAVPTVILGPGEPQLAHKTDEYVALSRLEEAVRIYRAALGQWEG